MTSLYSIPGITDTEVKDLKAKGYLTAEGLWADLKDNRKGALKDLADHTGLCASRLAKLLSADIAREGAGVHGSFVSRHWLDLAVVLAAILLLWGAHFGLRHPTVATAEKLVVLRVTLKEVPADPSKIFGRTTLLASPHGAGDPVEEEVSVDEFYPGEHPAAKVVLTPKQLRRLGRVVGNADLDLVLKR
jgi:hypothetical protein